jgi:hypothetical protein
MMSASCYKGQGFESQGKLPRKNLLDLCYATGVLPQISGVPRTFIRNLLLARCS